ncbi:MAG: Vacuolar protease A [Thelocarpon impressellum]|nr:MAG: Vacuolar protease A [Thelocarpon impressellum]
MLKAAILWCVGIVLLSYCLDSHAASLRSTLHPLTRPVPGARIVGNGHHADQQPLSTLFTFQLVYTVAVDIGTPPQRFQVVLDLSSPDTFVNSVDCVPCSPKGGSYNASASSTSCATGLSGTVEYMWIKSTGRVVKDVLRLDNIALPAYSFVDATEVDVRVAPVDDWHLVHGVLGMAPSSAGSKLRLPSVLMTLAADGVLDHNLLALRLREPREMSLGAVNPALFVGDVAWLPLTHHTSRHWLNGTWQAKAVSLIVGSTHLHYSLEGLTASFHTEYQYILLPALMVLEIWHVLGFNIIDSFFPTVPCDQRAVLPDITLNLAGHNLTLSPYDYTIEWGGEVMGDTDEDPQSITCTSAIMPISPQDGEVVEIYLGSVFLKAFYSVWDLDASKIGLATLSN